ncbi:MAG: RDD family protein [Archangium sp.]|nr:RDD family protein [Archangium sp.]
MTRPFAAPLLPLEARVRLPGLAPRTVRLAAAFLDTLLVLPLLIIWLVAAAGSLGLSLGALAGHLKERPWLSQAGTVLVGSAAWVAFAATSVALACLVLYQWFLLSTRGQTIGKRVMGIRIVDLEGQPVGFFSALLLRSWIYSSVVSAAVSFTSVLIPFAGAILFLLDYVPLFGEDRRCLHDYLAGTQVRWVRVIEVYVGRLVGAVAGVALIGGTVAAALNRDALLALLESPPPVVAAVTAPQPQPGRPQPPPPAPEPVAVVVVEAAPVEKKLYQFTDDRGVVHVTDDLGTVPEKYRAKTTTP